MPVEEGRINARPAKAFFVTMLTRDITLDDCILDLVDNSIDGAWESAHAKPSDIVRDSALNGYKVEVNFSRESFSISDNCGGIARHEALNYAFTFGRIEDPEHTDPEFTVGVYGIGMKRAIFKLGKSIRIFSTYEDNGDRSAFQVPIEVDEWAAQEDWEFALWDAQPAEQTGLRIEVAELSQDTSDRFGDPTYERQLRSILGRDYMLPLMRGLQISVNGRPVTGQVLMWQDSPDFAPLRVKYDDSGVTVDIIAGMNAPPPDDGTPDDPLHPDRISGWFVACNGRVVLAADRTALTGWGASELVPSWHNQYNGFLGLTIFSAADPRLLPMTTTKRSVDTSSGVYRRALVEMARPTRAWINYTNVRKNDRETAVRLEQGGQTRNIPDVQPKERLVLPNLSLPPREPVANVNYSVRRKRLRKLAEGFGNVNLTYREVGLRSFDYAYDQLVDEDE
jgi:hypothetical protein